MTQPRVQVEYIGSEGRPVAVIDDFASDPDRLVADAAGLMFQPLGAYYPGLRAPVLPSYFDGLGGLLARVLGEVFGARDRLAFDRALYSVSAAPPEDLSLAQRIPHIDDTGQDRFAIIHYLCREDFGGTAFYRQKATGFETVTADRHAAYIAALKAGFAQHGEPPPAYIAGDTPLFARIGSRTPAFNRAVIYPSNLLHCAALPNDRVLPSDPRIGRLTVASFLTAR